MAFAVVMVLSLILGQAVPEPYGTLVTFGPLGIFVALYLAGIIPSKGELDRTIARAVKAEDQRDALAEKALTDTIPLLGEVNRTMIPTVERLVGQVGDLTSEVRRMSDRLHETERGRGAA